MAALALRETRSLLPTLHFSIARWLPPILGSAAVGWPTISRSLPSLQSFLELFPPIVLAVPKKKTSHSRKAMRAANKGLKDKQSMFFLESPFPLLTDIPCMVRYYQLRRLWCSQTGTPYLSQL